ncbi:unnamed protein product [Rotaria sordida]|uniref:Uncharacterized protein n=1 Tax=Rotaria sordida TaxID=392033 RepID=A0A814GAK6_9BILA|nr:unnamed protein product [Rotaria sordida]
MFRTHCIKNSNNDRRIWTFPWIYQNNLARFTRLRQTLIPYIYIAARHTYDSDLSVVLSLYYRQSVDTKTGLVENWSIWFPPNFQWMNFFISNLSSSSSSSMTKSFTLDEMPVYAQAGSIIPLLPEPRSSRERIGRAHSYWWIIERNTITYFEYTVSDNTLQFSVSAATSSFSSFPTSRTYEIQLRGIFSASNVLLNNVTIPFEPFNELIHGQDGTTNGYTYDGSTLSIIIYIRQPMSTSQSFEIQIQLLESITHPYLVQVPTSFVGLLA